jgi:AbrB family looped-hinge helix DNA binding protein
MATTVTSKGQVTIPKPIRARLGIERGDAIKFELAADGRVVMVKVGGHQQTSRFAALRACIGAGLGADEIMALTRGDM